jgi:hypothetical protein
MEEVKQPVVIEKQPVVIEKQPGGRTANINGKSFENITNYETLLLGKGFQRVDFNKGKNYYLVHENEETKEKRVYLHQGSFKKYMEKYYSIKTFRNPDEAYLLISGEPTRKIRVKILEKKFQNVSGSIETKLWSGPSLKRETEMIFGDAFEISYGFCMNQFLKEKINSNIRKYLVLRDILKENDISVLYGEDKDYFITLDKWIHA